MELGLWRIRRGGDPADVYAMWNSFGGDLLREKLTKAVEVEDVTPTITIDEMVRFINHRFDGLAYEFAASRDEAACERQTELLADAIVMLAGAASKKRAPAAARRVTSRA